MSKIKKKESYSKKVMQIALYQLLSGKVLKWKSKPSWKPSFSAIELANIRTAETKKEREALVRKYRKEHLAKAGGAMMVRW